MLNSTIKKVIKNTDKFCYFTLQNNRSGTHRTFRVKKQRKNSKFAPDSLILGILSGSDNEKSYKHFAFVNTEKNTIYTWAKYRNTHYEKYSKILEQIIMQEKCCEQLKVIHSGNCIKCGKLLTDPESIKTGLGPICAGRL